MHLPSGLSPDGKALMVDGGIGYSCWISPDGDVYMETYTLDNEDAPIVDRSRRAQLLALSLGVRTFPQLESLLPPRPANAVDCPECQGAGRFQIGKFPVVCSPCCGLGWLENAEPDVAPDASALREIRDPNPTCRRSAGNCRHIWPRPVLATTGTDFSTRPSPNPPRHGRTSHREPTRTCVVSTWCGKWRMQGPPAFYLFKWARVRIGRSTTTSDIRACQWRVLCHDGHCRL